MRADAPRYFVGVGHDPADPIPEIGTEHIGSAWTRFLGGACGPGRMIHSAGGGGGGGGLRKFTLPSSLNTLLLLLHKAPRWKIWAVAEENEISHSLPHSRMTGN